MFYLKRNSYFVILISLICWAVGSMLIERLPVAQAQSAPTATPNAEGVIYMTVQPNDSLWGIAAGAGISLSELLALNEMTEDTVIQPGQQLIIGYGTPPATATVVLPTPTVTPTRLPPTPTFTPLPPPRTAICIKAFSDTDRDGVHDAGEPFQVNVAFTVFNEAVVVGNYITNGISEPYCWEGLTPGDYKVTRSIGRNETLTTAGNWSLTLTRGSVLNIEFGSFSKGDPTPTVSSVPIGPADEADPEQMATVMPSTGGPASEGLLTPLVVGIIIILVLLFAGGLLYAARFRKPTSRN